MKQFFATLPRNVIACFKGRMLLWHLAAIVLTFVCVQTGFDWFYFTSTRNPVLWHWTIPAAPIGMFVPVLLPMILVIGGIVGRAGTPLPAANHEIGAHGVTRPAKYGAASFPARAGWAIAQSEIIGSLISSFYKAFTGRVHPQHGIGPDISHEFRFGLLRGGTFWGWPSSHTTVAFAMAATVSTLYPKQRWLGILAMLYALYIGVGVSMTIHWFSDFAAGAIIGSVVGIVVGKSFFRQAV